MKKHLILITLFITSILLYGQEYNSIDYKNFEKANAIFTKLEKFNYNRIDTFYYRLSGTWHYLGHYSVPKQRREIHLSISIDISQYNLNKAIFSVDNNNKTLIQAEYFSADTAYIIPYQKTVANIGEHLRKESSIPFYSPLSVYWDLKNNKSSLRYIGEDTNTFVLSYASSFYRQVSAIINKQNYRIEAVEFLCYNDIDGDHFLKYNYCDYELKFGYELPSRLLITEWDTPLQELEYSDTKIIESNPSTPLKDYKLKELVKNLYLITLPTGQHQSFVVDYGDYIGIIEIPINEIYAKQIVDFATQNFPDKPVKYAFLTHHHPDHAGGFAYLYKNGVDVVTTRISQAYQEELLDRKHLLREEKITYTQKGSFIIIPSLTQKDFSNKNIKMIAYEMGENSHTKEFILYYFPQSKILVVGDLFYTSEGAKPYASIRAKDIANFIEKEGLEVEKLYQTWGWDAKEYSTIEDLRKSVEMYDQKNKTKE